MIEKEKMKTEETPESFVQCFKLNSRRRKIIVAFLIFLIGIVVLVIASGIRWKLHENQTFGRMMYGSNGNRNYHSFMMNNAGFYNNPSSDNSFVLPQDAAKSGEIALVVDDLDATRKAISLAASKNGGIVYFENISYASENVKNGSVIVQIPLEKFDATFANLKTVGSKIIKESTQQIAPRNTYIVPMAAQEKVIVDDQDVTSSSPTSSSTEPMIYPAPQQVSQNKGYVRVIFVDYEKKEYQNRVFGIFGSSQNINGLWIAFGLKLVVLIVLLVVLLLVFQKIIRDIRAARAAKKAKPLVRGVRQASKSRQHIVKIAKRR